MGKQGDHEGPPWTTSPPRIHGRDGPRGRPGRYYAYLLYFAGLNRILLGRTLDPVGGSSLAFAAYLKGQINAAAQG
ncbi:MAG: hypothetical protein E6J33_08430, partial [Chloroflexi bacterium]